MDSHHEKSSTPTWQDFTQDTTMHGIRYIKMKSITNARRFVELNLTHRNPGRPHQGQLSHNAMLNWITGNTLSIYLIY